MWLDKLEDPLSDVPVDPFWLVWSEKLNMDGMAFGLSRKRFVLVEAPN